MLKQQFADFEGKYSNINEKLIGSNWFNFPCNKKSGWEMLLFGKKL